MRMSHNAGAEGGLRTFNALLRPMVNLGSWITALHREILSL